MMASNSKELLEVEKAMSHELKFNTCIYMHGRREPARTVVYILPFNICKYVINRSDRITNSVSSN